MKSKTVQACGSAHCRRSTNLLIDTIYYPLHSAAKIALLIILAIPSPLWAITYYVDAQLGDDSFDGLSPAPEQGIIGPWKSLSQVNNMTFSPGDSILFKRGSMWVDETLVPKNGGMAGGTITMTELINGQQRTFEVVDPSNNNCIYFGAYGSGNKPKFQCDGRRGIEIRHNHLIFENIHLSNGANNVLWFHNSSGNYWSIVSNIDITNCTGNAVRSSEGGGNLWLRGLYIYDYATNGIYLEGSASHALKGVLVENCHVEDPVIVDKEDAIACHDDAAGNHIDGNIIIRNSRFIMSGEDGVDVTSGTFILIEGNEIEHCYEAAVHIDKSWVSNVEVRGNFINSNSMKKGLGDLTIRANNCRAVNNIIIGTGHHSVFLEKTSNTKLWNNVIAPGNRTGNFIFLRADLSNIDIRNNIFDFSRTTQKISGTITAQIIFDYNCYFGTSPSQNIYGGGTFADMQSDLNEANGFWTDPNFMDANKSEPDHFKLQTTSPCLDKGNSVPLGNDYWGNVRPQGTEIDVGAYESSVLLPVSLINFIADLENGNISLRWITAHEINNDHFVVERSYDGHVFQSIGKVRSKGSNSSTELFYHFIDRNPIEGLSYYRLKQTDFSGTYSYSPIRMVERGGKLKTEIFPNPFDAMIRIRLRGIDSSIDSFCIFNATGHLVYQQRLNANARDWEVDVRHIPVGVYYLHIVKPQGKVVHKIIKI